MTTPLEDDGARLATLLADICTYATQMLAGMATRPVTGSSRRQRTRRCPNAASG